MKKIILIMFLFLGLNQVYAIPNPASVFCEENKGSLEIVNHSMGICRFADGSECEEWSYYKGDCKPGMYQDWINEKESKKHILSYSPSEAGFIKYSEELPLITKDEIVSKPEYINEADADYVYKKMVVQSINQFAQNDSSEEAILLLVRDGDRVGQIDIDKLSYYQTDYVYLYIPLENEGEYSIVLETSTFDEPQGNEKFSIPNTFAYKGTMDENNNEENQKEPKKISIFDWIKLFFRKIF